MTLILSGDIRLAQGYTRPDDADAVAYITAVEAADGQPLETEVRMAINTFVKGCKVDGIWDAIKASCILAGARTLNGALVPLAGAAPTNYNFVAGDYNRKTGLVGDGSTKYLNSNRNNNDDPRDSKHLAVYQTSFHTRDTTRAAIGSGTGGLGDSHLITAESPPRVFFRINTGNVSADLGSSGTNLGLWGSSRSGSSGYVGRFAGVSNFYSDISSSPSSGLISVFARSGDNISDARLAFYSIGESLDLALLDARVTDLINKFAEVIP